MTNMPDGFAGMRIHELFECQAKQRPEHIALRASDEVVSYGELNALSNRIARMLQRSGVGPEDRVGVYADRSVDAAAALIAILKAGATYVYLDPTYPELRLSQMASDADCALILATSRSEQSLGRALRNFPVFSTADSDRELSENLRREISAENIAYITFTSGSTGRPKGVMETHRSLTARLAKLPLPDIREDDICSLNSGLGFGISASRLFLPLGLGAQVVIVGDAEVKNIQKFGEIIVRECITSLFAVSSLLERMLREIAFALPSIRVVSTSGGVLTANMVSAFCERLPNAELVNLYGGSELGTTASMWRAECGPNALIGRAVANTRIYLMDPAMNVTAGDIDGEIYVASPNLARGYVDDASATAERFLPDPFGPPGGRMYRTGDFGRRHQDGQIEFLGRADEQVKIRGFRVELGEIKAALLAHSEITDAAVGIVEKGAEPVLRAYVVPKSGSRLHVESLRNYLYERLPEHMVPGPFLILDSLPVTPAGKVDGARLASMRESKGAAGEALRAPRNPVEALIADVWARHLRVEDIMIDDDFLALGGHSMTIAGAAAEIQDLLGVEIPPHLFFEAPTIERLVERVFAGAGGEAKLAELCGAVARVWALSDEEADRELQSMPRLASFPGA